MMNMLATQDRSFAGPRAFRLIGGNTEGSVAIEYGLIAALIVLAIVGVLGDVRDALVGLPLLSLIDAFTDALS